MSDEMSQAKGIVAPEQRPVSVAGVRFGRNDPVLFVDCAALQPLPRLGERVLVDTGDEVKVGRIVVAPDQVLYCEMHHLTARAVRRLDESGAAGTCQVGSST
jgi:hypothetical protein